MENIKIVGSGYAVAEHQITNDDLTQVIDTSDEWIVARTGIRTRYVSSEENTSDLGVRAALHAIQNANVEKGKIGLIICATMTPDHITPSSACLIQAKLGLNESHVMAFDINAACSGYVYAFQIACALVPQYEYALIIGSETISKILDWEDRNTCVLFGDGAGAMILKAETNHKRVEHFAQSSGDIEGFLQASGLPLASKLKNAKREVGFLHQNGSEVFRFAVKAMDIAIQEVLKKSEQSIEDIDLIIAHQANLRIIKHVAKKMKVDMEKFYINLDRYGNTSAASIAIAFGEAQEKGLLKEGMKIILVGFGAGFTYASSYIEL